MSSVRAIAKNTAWLTAADLINKLAAFALSVLIARQLGSETFGAYSFALAFAFFFALAADFGISKLLVRQIARDRIAASVYLGNAVPLKIALTLLAYGLFILITWGIGYPPEMNAILLLFGAALLGDTISHTFRALFFALERMGYEAVILTLEKVIALGLSILAITLGYGIIGVGVVFVAVTAASIVGSAILAGRLVSIRLQVNLKYMKDIFSAAWPFLLINFFFLVYFKIDTVMLSFMQGDAVVGWYNAAYRIIEGLMFIPVIFTSVMFPVMSRLAASQLPSLQMSVRRSFTYLLVAVVPVAIGGIMLSDRFISLIYGSAFDASVPALQILLAALVFVFVIRPISAALLTVGQERLNMHLMMVFSVLNIALNLIFIPLFSHIGAALTTLICEALLLAAYLYYYQKHIGMLQVWKRVGKTIAAGMILAAAVWLGLARGLPLGVIIAGGAVIYGGMVILLGIIRPAEWQELKDALLRRKTQDI